MKKHAISLQWKFFLCITLIVVPAIGIIFVWEGVQVQRQAMDQVKKQARILVRQVILTRQWVADCGGILVDRDTTGARETNYFFDSHVQTPQAFYQIFTPAMVTKKLSQYSLRQGMYQFRLVSLKPMNSENSPDAFEAAALKEFEEQKLTEISRVQGQGKAASFQYMVPLTVDKACLQCHKEQGFSEKSVGGGLSVFLPIGETASILRSDQYKLAGAGLGFTLLTIMTLFVFLRRLVIRPLKELEVMTTEIGKGNLDRRVNISTGDEIERLGLAFNSMAEKLSDKQDMLEERVRQATSELAQANQELKTLDKMKSDFLADMSHELRSPLTVIRGGFDYLNRTISGNHTGEYLKTIDKNLTRLIHLVTDLFDITKIQAGTMNWSFEWENVSSLVQEIIEIISPLAEESKIAIHYERPGDIFAEMDLERMEQVIVNLIQNAVKFSSEGTTINMEVREEGENVLVVVKDQGCGIPEDKLKVIFEKFRMLPSSGGRGKCEGTGLGLAICKGIVEAHGGRIWAESVQGEGSTFYLSLARARTHERPN